MKNILFLGDYFPHFSFDTLRNHKIVESLHAEGFRIYYLSNSWCDVDEHSFASPYMHKETGYIRECYAVDPIELRNSNSNIALAALAKSIVLQNHIDYLFVSDVKKYGMAAEAINTYFDIPIIASLWSDESFYHLYESYTKIWFDSFVSKIKYLYTHTCRKGIYDKYSDRTNILPVLPYKYSKVPQEKYKDFVIVIGNPGRRAKIEYLSSKIVDLALDKDVKVLIWGEFKDVIYENLKNTQNSRIEYIDYKDGIKIFEKMMGATVVSTETLINSTVGIYDKYISIDTELLLLSYGLRPLIPSESKTFDILEHFYAPTLDKYNGSSHILSSLGVDEEIFNQYL